MFIVRNKRKCHLVSNTPAHLHKILWKAYLMDEFYSHRNYIHEEPEAKVNLVGLPELLFHWPYKEFNLKEVMPFLYNPHPFKDPTGDKVEEVPFNEFTGTSRSSFYSKVVLSIVKTFSAIYDFISAEYHIRNFKIVKLDISGYHDLSGKIFN